MALLNDRYEILRPLGRGATGRVDLAVDRRRSRTVAIKTIQVGAFGLSAEGWARRQHDLLRTLHHPSLPRVLGCEIDQESGRPFLIEELIEGEDVRSTLRGRSIGEIVPVLVQICRALDYLHARGFLHGDLQPRNIVLSSGDQVTLLAPLLAPQDKPGEDPARSDPAAGGSRPNGSAEQRWIFGTLGYQAPEVLCREGADGRADIYSLGVVAHELLAGQHPFAGRDPVDVIRHQLHGEPVPLAALGRRLPSALVRIVQKMLQQSAEDRFEKASDVILAINMGLGHTFPVESAATRAAYVVDPPTVGRDRELTRIHAALAATIARRASQAIRARPLAILITGPPGIGKARLVTESVRAASARGMRVLAGPPRRDDPVLGPFAGWLRELASQHPSAAARFGALRDYLGGVLDTRPADEIDSARREILDQAIDLLAESTTTRDTLIAIRDLHERSEPSFDLLVRLIATCQAPHRLLIVASCDEERLPHPRRLPLERLAGEGMVEVMRLTPFGRDDVVALLEVLFEPAPWCDALGRALLRATNGILSGLLESLRALIEEGTIVREKGHWKLARPVTALPIPEGLRTAVARRSRLLDSGCRAVLEALAVLERSSNAAELARLTGRSEPETKSALDILSQRGFMGETGEDEVVAFGLVAEVTRESMRAARRRAIHARALADLETHGSMPRHVVELARHAAGARDEGAIRQYVRQAARRAMDNLDYEAALELLGHALGVVSDPTERLDLMLERGRLLLATGWSARAVAAYEQAVRLARQSAGDAQTGRALLGLAHAVLEVGDLARAAATIDEATGLSRTGDHPLQGSRVREQLVRLAIDRGDLASARPPLSRSLRDLRGAVEPPAGAVLARLEVQLARLHALAGRPEHAEKVIDRLLRPLDQTKDHEGLALARRQLAEIRLQQGRLDDAERTLLDLVTPGHCAGSGAHASSVFRLLGLVYVRRGEIEQACGWLERARALAIASGNTLLEAEAEWGLGRARATGRRHAEALGHFERSVRLHESLGRGPGQTRALAEIGACYRLMGRLQSALETFERVLTLPDTPAARTVRIRALCGRAEIERQLGMLDQAEDDLEKASSGLGAHAEPDLRVEVWTQKGRVHLQRGALAYALESFKHAIDAARRGGETAILPEALDALAGTAEVALAQGERFRAATRARRLLEQAQSPGYTSALARAHILMAEALRGPPAPPALEGHLTDAVLLAEASSDRELYREIAQRAARLREETRQPEAALELYERAASCVEEVERSLTKTTLRHAYHRTAQRDRAAQSARRLRNQLVRDRSAGRRPAEPSDTLLARLVELNQCQKVDQLLGQAAGALLTITGMPLGFGLLSVGGTPVRLIGVGAAEGEALGSSRMEGVLDLARRCLSTGQVLICADVAGTREYRELLVRTTHPLRSFVCVPLHASSRPGEVLGVLFSGDPEPLSLERVASTERLATLARGIAGHLATLLELGAVERDRTVLSEERHTLAVLRRSAEALGGPRSLDERLNAALEVVREASGVDCLAVIDLRAAPPRARWMSRPDTDRYDPERRVSRAVLELMLATGRSLSVDQAHSTPPFSSFQGIRDLCIESVAVSPVVVDEQIIAALYADRIEASAGEVGLPAYLDFLDSFAQQVGSALVRDQLDRDLARSRQQIETIFDSAPYPMVAVDPQFIIRAWNDAAERVLGHRRKDVVGHRRLEALLSKRHPPALRKRLLKRLEATGVLDEEIWLQAPGSREFLAAVTARAMTTRNGEHLGYTGIVRDLTPERNAQAAIRRSEQIMSQLTDGVLVMERNGMISYANPAAERLFGYGQGTLVGQPADRLWSGSGRETDPWGPAARATDKPPRTELAGRCKDGTFVPISLSISSLRDEMGQVIGHLAIVSDTSLQKRHEDELRRLSERIITAQEEERRRLARELHDESGQALAALHINLEFLATLLPENAAEPIDLLHKSLEIIDQTQAEFRRLAGDLHPAVLENFGLIPALRRYVSGLSQAGGLQIEIDARPDALVPPGRAATALYRIAQEALANVVRHAQARQAAVRLRRRGARVCLVVADDGCGFETAALTGQDGIGIIGMRERAGALGGRVRIRSIPERGCVVRAWMDVETAADELSEGTLPRMTEARPAQHVKESLS